MMTCRRGMLVVVVLGALVVFPGIDLTVSGWFFADGRFFLRHHGLFEFVRAATPPVTLGVALFVAMLGGAGAALRETFFGLSVRRTLYLLATLAVGPGLLANSLFKDHWGRARPSTLALFGGDKTFTPALVLSDQCGSNCSFVSGHAALAFWGVAFAMLAPVPWRRWAVAAAVGYGFFVGFVRVAQGAHFFSDVVFAAALVVGVVFVLRRLDIEG